MFHPRPGMRDEQAAQLQELNSRLSVYLSRVRQLEQENQYLVEEIESLRLDREVEWKREYEAEISQLRRKVEELTLEKSQAEIERDSLWQEFQLLQLLCGEVQAIRMEIDKELVNHRADLKQAEDSHRALEELLLRLHVEYETLVEACEQEVVDLQGGLLRFPVQVVRQQQGRVPGLSMQEVEGYDLEISQSWKESFLMYQRKVEELEGLLCTSGESLEGVEEEKRLHVLEMGELQREAEELDRIRQSLEEELRSMREKYSVEVEEYQIIIESLEDEKQSLALTITDRLKDYHELMQAKTGLSLEVAAYRALLEGENNQEMFTWTEEQMRKIPQGSQATAHEHIGNYSLQQRENARRFYPAIRSSMDTRHKTHLSQVSSWVPHSGSASQTGGSRSGMREDTRVSSYRPSATIKEEASYQRKTLNHTGFQTFTSGHGLPRRSENRQHRFPAGGAAVLLANDSTSSFHRSSQNLRDAPKAGLSQATKPKLETGIKTPGYELSWELRGRKQVMQEGQVMSKEKTKEEEPSEVATKRIPGSETKSEKSIKMDRIVTTEEKALRGGRSYVFDIQTENQFASERQNIDVPIKVTGIGQVQEKKVEENQTHRDRNFMVNEQVKSEGKKGVQEGLEAIEIPIKVIDTKETTEERTGLGNQTQRERNFVVKEQGKSEGEGLTTIEIPIQVIRTREMWEERTGISQAQMEKNFLAKELVKSEEENDTQEGLTVLNIPIQVTGTRESWEKRTGINQTQREINITVREQGREDKSAEGESYVESEERIRGYESMKGKTNWTVEQKSNEDLNRDGHTPNSSEDRGKDQGSQHNNIQITVRGSTDTDAEKDVDKAAENPAFSVPAGESGLNTAEEVSTKHSSKMKMSWGDDMAENVTVADILKHFGHSTDQETAEGTSSDAKVTYAETKQIADDGTVTREIIVQSTTEEDFDMSDEEELEHLLNKSLEKTTLKHLKGAQAESFLENILHGGLKGKKGVSIEITEEPLGSATDEQDGFSVPFEVEEADDVSPGLKGNFQGDEGALHASMTAQELKDGTPPTEDTTHVEDVTEAGDTGEDLEYIVSTPDEFSMGHGEHEESLYGQVHIEEESSIRYSWQDAFLQRKPTSDEHELDSTTQTQEGTSDQTSTTLVEEELPRKEACHVEGLVIEKEIKIPQEFQTSILGLLSKELKDPKHNLKGALEQLEESLPGILRDELSALSTDSQEDSNNLAVGIKKVEQTTENGVVTIVAEINVSQTVETDHFDALNHLEGSPDIIEEARMQSAKKNDSENLQGHIQESIGKSIQIDVSTSGNKPTLRGSSKLTTNIDVAGPTAEESLQERPVSEPPEPGLTDDINQAQMSVDMNRFVRHIKLGPQEIQTIEHVIFEGPISERVELGTAGKHSPTEGLSDVSRSTRHFKLGPMEIHTTQHITSEGSSSDTLEHGGDFPSTEGSRDTNRSIRHIKLDPREMFSSEQIIFEGPISDTQALADLSPTEGAADINRSIRHIKLGPREMYSSEQIIFEGPITETEVLGDQSAAEGAVDINRSIRHIKLGSKEMHQTQQIVFEGPICESSSLHDSGDVSTSVNRSIKHFKLSPTEIQTTEHIIFKGPLSQSAEHAGTENISESEINRSIRHIELGSKTQATEQIIFEGPISKPLQLGGEGDRAQKEESTDSNSYIRHIKLSPKDFQNSEQIIFEGVSSEPLHLVGEADRDQEEESNNSNSYVRHIKLSPKDFQNSEQIVFEGAISEPLQLGGGTGHSQEEELADSNSYVRHIKLSPKDFQNSEQIIFEGPISQNLGDLGKFSPTKESTEMTTSIRHIKIGSREMKTSEEATFEQPILERLGSNDTGELPLSDESMEANRSIKHIKLGPQEKSFTFQMDVTQFATVPSAESGTQEATMIFSSRTFTEDPNLEQPQNESEGQKDGERSNGETASPESVPEPYEEYLQARGQKVIDTSIFDKTVQLQRMVDQRSMISDDKKIAVVYLDNEEDA